VKFSGSTAYRASIGGSHISIGYDLSTTGSCDVIKPSQRIQKVPFTVMAKVKASASEDSDLLAPPPGRPAGSSMGQLKREIKIEDATRLLGSGKQLSESVGEAGLKTQAYEYLSSERRMEITYVEGLVVRYSFTSE
jgi:hypothetical protein